MANSKELSQYIMEQLSDLGNVRNIPMMGGYIFYYKERWSNVNKVDNKKWRAR